MPLTLRSWPFSTAFRMLSSLMALKLTDGRPVSTVTSWLPVPVLPAASVTDAVTVTVPSLRPEITLAGTPTLQLPAASSTVVYVWPPMVTVTLSPAAAPVAVPLMMCA
ncbi:Uncharacterised protein [Enterobacter cloacae]|nr:Uncharacterised protein [Enterobacter cloacae]